MNDTPVESTLPSSKPPGGPLSRFSRLLSAQVVEALLSTIFFLYLAWQNAAVYGEIMVALAAGSLVKKMVGFGLYYPLVKDLARQGADRAPVLLGRVSLIKLVLLALTVFIVWGLMAWSGFSGRLGGIVLFISLGFGADVLADTFFADLRIRGHQRTEAGIKIGSSVLGYGYGFMAALLGFGPLAVSGFKLVSGLLRLFLSAQGYLKPLFKTFLHWVHPKGLWAGVQPAIAFALIDTIGTVYNKTNIFFLERFAGAKTVAYYSAAWNLIDPLSILGSELFLAWIIFPILAVLWERDRNEARTAVRSNALWLLAVAMPLVFFISMESDLIFGLFYPAEYHASSWTMRVLVWTIPLSFETNLLAYVMMVAGATRKLLVFSAMTLGVNLVLNLVLVGWLGLAGGVVVILATKTVMTGMTAIYCQRRFGFMSIKGLIFPLTLMALGGLVYIGLEPLIGFRPALGLSLISYIVALWRLGPRFLGRLSPA